VKRKFAIFDCEHGKGFFGQSGVVFGGEIEDACGADKA